MPSAAQPLRQPDQRFLESEAFTNKFEKHLSGSMEKVNRRVLKRWSGASLSILPLARRSLSSPPADDRIASLPSSRSQRTPTTTPSSARSLTASA